MALGTVHPAKPTPPHLAFTTESEIQGRFAGRFNETSNIWLNYMRTDHRQEDSAHRETALAAARRNPGIVLGALLETAAAADARDCLYSMIALGELYVDLSAASLWEPERVHVFPDRDSAQHQVSIGGGTLPGWRTNLIDLQPGDRISWDTKEWIVANAGSTMVSLVGPDRSFTEIPATAFEEMVKDQRVQISQNASHHQAGGIRSQIANASEADLEVANRRSYAVRSHLLGDHPPGIPARTIRLWTARFREAEQAFGDGYLGLIPQTRNRGNRQARIAERPRALMAQFIEKDYETFKQKSKYRLVDCPQTRLRTGGRGSSQLSSVPPLPEAPQPIYPDATS
jgi:putative transposase